jgi:hypothetical protein
MDVSDILNIPESPVKSFVRRQPSYHFNCLTDHILTVLSISAMPTAPLQVLELPLAIMTRAVSAV